VSVGLSVVVFFLLALLALCHSLRLANLLECYWFEQSRFRVMPPWGSQHMFYLFFRRFQQNHSGFRQYTRTLFPFLCDYHPAAHYHRCHTIIPCYHSATVPSHPRNTTISATLPSWSSLRYQSGVRYDALSPIVACYRASPGLCSV
jgi:hypothetical protein